ncbi:MAG: hypothetical protein A3I63_00415 [Betaproteobacteria bacterium RIFCSPLOWO2_02_FULL_66_14]|nr:MAG: hypothetical protein A3I63_00415 [Betaproteobacteria bacterium RIFCSPLOWO2_02_FULL_66_14]
METLLSPQSGLAGLTLASFVAATLVPLSSEAVLFGYLKLYPDHALAAVTLATLGNTAGGMTTYWIGRLVPARQPGERSLQLLRRYGAPATFFAWLPLVGDALCLAAGWLRIHWLAALLFMAAGRLARYVLIAQSAYWS